MRTGKRKIPASCRIEFDNSPLKVVYSGQLIKGVVIVKLFEATALRGVYLNLLGGAYSKFSEKVGSTRITRKESEKYLDENVECFDGTEGKTLLDIGTYRFEFKCQLKESIPTSLEEKTDWCDFFVSVRYKVIIRFSKSLDESPVHEEFFTVIKPLNLNLLPNLHKPFSQEYRKRFCYCCCLPCFKSNELKIVARLSQQGLVPGQNIDVQLDVLNRSIENIRSIKVQLIREVALTSFKENGYVRGQTGTTKLTKQMLDLCESDHKEIKTYNVSITVPSTPPSDEHTNKYIKISYKILLTGYIGWSCRLCLTDPPEMEIPVTIGTFPIIREMNKHNSANLTTELFPASNRPTYELAVYSKYDKLDGFKPKYPIYR